MRRLSTAITITDPLVKYQTLVKSGVYSPDHSQYRLARHLRDLYLRIKDYSPRLQHRQRLDQLGRLLEPKPPDDKAGPNILALRHHSIWRNPLFKHLLPTIEDKDSLALTRVLSSHEKAIEVDSPKGLFLFGEVGTGKSMLIDLLAEGLPTDRKRRWHFNTFMLYTLAQLERHRKTASGTAAASSDHSLAWMAKKLVDESPILFLDEFQLPDRAAGKILSHLFIAFFQLGGILVATSNRMPEELQKATGVDYASASSRFSVRNLWERRRRLKGELFGQSSDFANFLEVLKARCDFWQMEGARDWRRIEAAITEEEMPTPLEEVSSLDREEESTADQSQSRKRPQYYYLSNEEQSIWDQRILSLVIGGTENDKISWEPSELVVYGRKVSTPRHYNGFVLWDFHDLVGLFGPADYLTMASSYHTFLIDKIPVLNLLQKNEARRFITLLDALYEARCKLIVRAQSPPDELFFPQRAVLADDEARTTDLPDDATYSETVAEVYQDQTSPFRPNISYYDSDSNASKYDHDHDHDLDSDFGPQSRPVDFAKTGVFTGEDERFAYKRAVSRLWELGSARWHGRTGSWWRPLPLEARHWEGGPVLKPRDGKAATPAARAAAERMGGCVEEEEQAGLSKWRIAHLRKQNAEESVEAGKEEVVQRSQ